MQDIRRNLQEQFNQKRSKRQEEAIERRYELYNKNPRFLEIDNAIREGSLEILNASQELEDQEDIRLALSEMIERKISERKELLKLYSLPENYLEIHFDCPICQDKGYVDGKDCKCFKTDLAKLLYRSEDLTDGRGEDLEHWNADIFKNPEQRSNVEAIHRYSTNYVNGFPREDGHSLIFFGESGLGKTYLSNAIAKSLIAKGYYVIYQSAPDLFRVDIKEMIDYRNNLYNCDLLVIDDLGKENLTPFMESELFNLINHRVRKHKSFVISTNLSINGLKNRYGNAIFNRLIFICSTHEFFGEELRGRRG